ncbi:hypothetical protein LTR70_009832 [Exophiala xenobiotica]|uniref:Uncharacterized protein n=1 Tax=Lithohypha guttulata TaxID=1690604 RepID=A0ABR0JX80_9EURO|nr:hypothetical protein LTR24_009495 [Lithohypha guttulata]KAK5309984.1 hypothetical protein LTR70_009832 [Exophiala xenobiotica]
MSISHRLFCHADAATETQVDAANGSYFKPGSPGNSQAETLLTSTSQTDVSAAQSTSTTSAPDPSSSPTTFSTITTASAGPTIGDGSSSASSALPPTVIITTHTMPTATIIMTLTPTPTPAPTPTPIPTVPASATHHPNPHDLNLSWLLPVVLILGIPLFLLAIFFLFRRTCPATYAKTDKYCPFRATGRQLAKIPPVAAYLQRRERNRGIRARQHDYMSRRAKFGLGHGHGHSRKGSAAEMMTVGVGAEQQRQRQRKDEARRDEWLRSDMLAHYAREKGGIDGTSTAHRGGVGRGSNENENDALWPTSPSATLVNKRSRVNMRDTPSTSTYRYTPGRLTGDYIHEHEHEHEHGVTLPREMTLKQKIRAQREKILAEEAEAAGATDGAGSDGAEWSRHQPDGVGVGVGAATDTAKAKDGDGGEGIREGWVL